MLQGESPTNPANSTMDEIIAEAQQNYYHYIMIALLLLLLATTVFMGFYKPQKNRLQ